MLYNKLGRTDLNISRICLGTMTWGGLNSEAEGHRQMDYSIDQGINFFDTAEIYPSPTNKDTFGKEVHISNQFASGCGLSMIAQILPGRMWTFVLNLRDGEMSNPHRPDGLNDGLWSLTESARAVRDVVPPE